jgi:hypothetical protein
MSADRPPEPTPNDPDARPEAAGPPLFPDPPPPVTGREPTTAFRVLKGFLIALFVLLLGAVVLGLLVLGTCLFRR